MKACLTLMLAGLLCGCEEARDSLEKESHKRDHALAGAAWQKGALGQPEEEAHQMLDRVTKHEGCTER